MRVTRVGIHVYRLCVVYFRERKICQTGLSTVGQSLFCEDSIIIVSPVFIYIRTAQLAVSLTTLCQLFSLTLRIEV